VTVAEPTVRVAICDDHGVVRSGLRMILESRPDMEVVGDVGSVADALVLAEVTRPDVFLMDVTLPDGSGIAAAKGIQDLSPHTQVLILSMHDDVEFLRAAFDAGAAGYLVKEAADIELVLAIQTVAAGRRYVHPSLGAALLSASETPTPEIPREEPSDDRLSARERDLLRLLTDGYTNAEMAKELYLSVRTVESYRLQLQQKLGLKGRAELVRFARDQGIV
jgi:two-component system, NarL family, response regulator NreC